MTQETLTILICATACGYFKGKADTVAFDPLYIAEGWKGKYKMGRFDDYEELMEARYHRTGPFWRLYYAIINVNYVERFFGSTWIFSFLTDKLHLFNWCMWRCIELMVLVLSGYDWWVTIWFAVIRGIIFHYTFRRK